MPRSESPEALARAGSPRRREGRKIAVIIPCYNVESTIEKVVAGLPPFVTQIVAVEDASRDGTLAVLTRLAASEPRLVLIRHEANGGLGLAMADGFRWCIEAGVDAVVKIDGDDQMDPSYLPDLLAPLLSGECDYAKGNRFLHAENLRAMPRVRLIGNVLLTFMTKVASGYWSLFDPQNGYIAISADALRAIRLQKLDRRYFFENQMLIELNIHEAAVLDVPIPARYGDETSNLRIGWVLRHFPAMLIRGTIDRIYQRYVLRNFSILVPFLLTGLFFMLAGGGFGLIKWAQSIRQNVPATAGTVMLAVLPLIWGLQLVLQALLIDILNTPQAGYARFQQRRPRARRL